MAARSLFLLLLVSAAPCSEDTVIGDTELLDKATDLVFGKGPDFIAGCKLLSEQGLHLRLALQGGGEKSAMESTLLEEKFRTLEEHLWIKSSAEVDSPQRRWAALTYTRMCRSSASNGEPHDQARLASNLSSSDDCEDMTRETWTRHVPDLPLAIGTGPVIISSCRKRTCGGREVDVAARQDHGGHSIQSTSDCEGMTRP
ncbi:MAG: hypothetical protein H0V44_12870 [Planctomycetes bacterium]|nr:hypothetical protein [Planctomycetota bacterium]